MFKKLNLISATFAMMTILLASGFANAQIQSRPAATPTPLSVPTGHPVPVPKLNAAPTLETTQTDRENSSARELGISLAGNVLVFRTIEDYRRVVDNPTEEVSRRFRAAVSNYPQFQSYLSSKARLAKPAFNDEYFESMLNSDQIVQIGGNLFRVNPRLKKVFVLPAAKIEEYRDLVNENVENQSISVYSTDEDVLDLITGKASTQKIGSLFCHEGGVGSDAAKIKFTYKGSQIETLAAFNNYGIYYSLFAEVYPSAGANQFWFEFNNGYGYIHWHARCGATADYGTTSTGNNNGYLKQRFQSYQASKNLANFFFGYRILLKSNNAPLTGMNVIRKNW